VFIIKHLLCDPVYLALGGVDVVFHDNELFRRYVASLRDTVGVGGDCQLGVHLVETLVDSHAAQWLAEYLLRQAAFEHAWANQPDSRPEIGAIDQGLSAILQQLRDLADPSGIDSPGIAAPVPAAAVKPKSAGPIVFADSAQLGLFPREVAQKARNDVTFTDTEIVVDGPVMVAGSEAVPLVFKALVRLARRGRSEARGVDIASEVNAFVDDHRAKEASNISRALRNPALRSQEWLRITGEPRNYRFSLEVGWEAHWFRLFGAEAPVLKA
jgi:hypothetical protein